jgi:hypothetical protein
MVAGSKSNAVPQAQSVTQAALGGNRLEHGYVPHASCNTRCSLTRAALCMHSALTCAHEMVKSPSSCDEVIIFCAMCHGWCVEHYTAGLLSMPATDGYLHQRS